jgi:hypothetical protein
MDTEYFHGSINPISEITDSGVFGGVFATANQSAASSHGSHLYMIDSPKPLSDYELNYEIENAYDVALEIAGGNEDMADAIMSKECEVPDSLEIEPEDVGEYGWELQRMRGKLAARLGYTSVEMADEHGTTWLCLPGCKIVEL